MKSFLSRFAPLILSVLSGFDRLRFRGCNGLLNNAQGVNSYLYRQDLLIKEFPDHAESLTADLVKGTEAMAKADGDKVHYLNSTNIDKQATALEIARQRGLTNGRIAILSCLESCRTYRVRKSRTTPGHIEIRKEEGRCQHFYHYFLHEQVGLCYIRLQSWFPFTMRIGLNGRSWLYQQLRRENISYVNEDNILVDVDDWNRAQELLTEQLRTDWPTLLDGLAAQTNPMFPTLRDWKLPYYWTTEQSEWATDILFHRAEDLAHWYPLFMRHCVEVLNCRDILHYLGKKLPREGFGKRFTGEVKADVREREEGIRAKLWYNQNSLKAYDKLPNGMRLEPTINQPGYFTVYRPKQGDESGEKAWRPMRKGVADLYRQAEVSQRATDRFADSLATVADPTPLGKLLAPLGQPVIKDGKRTRALNPLTGADGELLRLIAQGDFLLHGFRNRDLRAALYGTPADSAEKRRQSAAVTRKLAMLRAHGLIVKVQTTHRYQLSAPGRRMLTALLSAHAADVNKLMLAA